MKNTQFVKAAILLVISLGLFWLSTAVSPASLFEPQSTDWILWVSYASNLILPFALYFFLCLGERWLKAWQARALVAFVIPVLIEIGQYLYYKVSNTPYVGSFDWLDIIVEAISVGLAVIVEQKVFAKLFKFWQPQSVTLHKAS